MGKLRGQLLRYLTKEDFRVLAAIELGMRNHEIVAIKLISQIANLRSGGVNSKLNSLAEHKLCKKEVGKHYDGYRLTNLGYDFLALRMFTSKDVLAGLGSQVGVGKESDIYVVIDKDENMLCLKLHRLGRTSFRKIRIKRDYSSRKTNWLYISRLSACKEYAFMKALYKYKFPVPKPICQNRHAVVMEMVNGFPLQQLSEVKCVETLYSALMNIIVRLANYGVIHSDFNEFNVIIKDDDVPVLIDFPQMVSTSHENAEMYFDRDVNCVREFFRRRFGYESELFPDFRKDVHKKFDLDVEIRASGFAKEVKDFDCNFREEMQKANQEKGDEEDEDDDYSDIGENEDDFYSCIDDNETYILEEFADSDHEEKNEVMGHEELTDKNEDLYKDNKVTNLKQIENELVKSDKSVKNQITGESLENLNKKIDTLNVNKESKDAISDKNDASKNNSEDELEESDAESSDSEVDFDLASQRSATTGNSNRKFYGRSWKKNRLSQVPTEIADDGSVVSSTTRMSALSHASAAREPLIKQILLAKAERKNAELLGVEPKPLSEFVDAALQESSELGDSASVCSWSTTASTIAPHEVRARCQKVIKGLMQKQVSKKSKRVKGSANAYNRARLEILDVIKEYKGWDKY